MDYFSGDSYLESIFSICYFIFGWRFSCIMSKNGIFVNFFLYFKSSVDFIEVLLFISIDLDRFSPYCSELALSIIELTLFAIFIHFLSASISFPVFLKEKLIEAMAFLSYFNLFNLSLYFF